MQTTTLSEYSVRSAQSPEDVFLQRERQASLKQFLNQLDPYERLVVEFWYNIGGRRENLAKHVRNAFSLEKLRQSCKTIVQNFKEDYHVQ